MQNHPRIASLPSNQLELADLQKLAPKSKKFQYIMMDSGASLHAAWAKKHFPDHLVVSNEAMLRGDYALTANGEKMFHEGEFDVLGDCDGVNMGITFTNMKVDVPVASVRRFVIAGNNVSFIEGGGIMTNRATGAKVRFIELSGVYFLKLRVKQPSKSPSVEGQSPSFTRPGN